MTPMEYAQLVLGVNGYYCRVHGHWYRPVPDALSSCHLTGKEPLRCVRCGYEADYTAAPTRFVLLKEAP